MKTSPLITDDQNLVSATSRFGSPIKVYDDSYGPLWIHRDSMGISGIVRARTWEDAYSICEDELFPDCDLTMEEIVKEYGFKREHVKVIRTADGIERDAELSDYPFDKTGCSFVRWETRETPDPEAWSENDLFCESYGFRPNGPNKVGGNSIYSKDINGDVLECLTPELLSTLEITLQIENQE